MLIIVTIIFATTLGKSKTAKEGNECVRSDSQKKNGAHQTLKHPPPSSMQRVDEGKGTTFSVTCDKFLERGYLRGRKNPCACLF